MSALGGAGEKGEPLSPNWTYEKYIEIRQVLVITKNIFKVNILK